MCQWCYKPKVRAAALVRLSVNMKVCELYMCQVCLDTERRKQNRPRHDSIIVVYTIQQPQRRSRNWAS